MVTVNGLLRKQGNHCFYCGNPMLIEKNVDTYNPLKASIDHFYPKKVWGFLEDNAVLSHRYCNMVKAAYIPSIRNVIMYDLIFKSGVKFEDAEQITYNILKEPWEVLDMADQLVKLNLSEKGTYEVPADIVYLEVLEYLKDGGILVSTKGNFESKSSKTVKYKKVRPGDALRVDKTYNFCLDLGDQFLFEEVLLLHDATERRV